VSMLFLGLTFGVAGVLQVYLERFLDIGYMTAHFTMMFWFKVAIFFGVFFLAGVLMTVIHLFTLKPVKEVPGEEILEGY
jgi:nitric oxide reductase subunit B